MDAAEQTEALISLAGKQTRAVESRLHQLHESGNARYDVDRVFDSVDAALAIASDPNHQDSLRRALLTASLRRAIVRFEPEMKWTIDDPRTMQVLLAAAGQRYRLETPQVLTMASDILSAFKAGRPVGQFDARAVVACAALNDPAKALEVIDALWKLDANEPAMVAIAGYRAIGGFEYRQPLATWLFEEKRRLAGDAEFVDKSDKAVELRRIYLNPILFFWGGDFGTAAPYAILAFDGMGPPLKDLPQLPADFRTLGLPETAKEVEQIIAILGPAYLDIPPEKREEAITPQMREAIGKIAGKPHNTWKPLLYAEKLAATNPEAFKLRRK